MNITLFYHSILSDWNHGNAHFLRGIVRELQDRGHQVRVFEPENGWSLQNLVDGYGKEKLTELLPYYPGLSTNFYSMDIHAGAWSLAPSTPRTSRSTPASFRREASCGESSRWSSRRPAFRSQRMRL